MSGGVAMVDIEFEAPAAYREALLACAAKHKVEAVISYHNYVETPVDLAAIVDTCFAQGASIAKVGVMARSAQDSARVLALYGSHYGAARRIVALAMGAPGMITRVAALSLGAPFTFVALSEASATAPGRAEESSRSIRELSRRERLPEAGNGAGVGGQDAVAKGFQKTQSVPRQMLWLANLIGDGEDTMAAAIMQKTETQRKSVARSSHAVRHNVSTPRGPHRGLTRTEV
jgi:hypothetical protein